MWVPAKVMTRVIVCNNSDVEKVKGEDVFCSKRFAVVKEAFTYVKNLEKNRAAKPVLEAFPYYPLPHDFPILEFARPVSFHD